ncbi:MAG TPA: hypothetical protein VLH84_03010 [Patescibacteria group bacterium]|nr:hypothetical protein [Patescibacteria group bacterium]
MAETNNQHLPVEQQVPQPGEQSLGPTQPGAEVVLAMGSTAMVDEASLGDSALPEHLTTHLSAQEAAPARTDVADLIARSQNRDPDARRALRTYLEDADASELLSKDVESLWRGEDVRLLVYRKIAQAMVDVKTEMWTRQERRELDAAQEALITRALDFFGIGQHKAKLLAAWREQLVAKFDDNMRPIRGEIDTRAAARMRSALYTNFTNMEAIQRAEPGAVKQLHEDDGICNFYSYNPRALVKQARESDARPDLTVLHSASNWNLAGGEYGADDMMDRLYGFRGDRMRIRFKEASDPDEFRYRLEQISSQHGPLKKLILWGHMNKYGVQLVKSTLTTDNIRGDESKGVPPLLDNSIIAPGCKVVIRGCDAGEEGGVGQAIADTTHARVLAPAGKVIYVYKGRFGIGTKFAGPEDKALPAKAYGPNRIAAAFARLRTPRKPSRLIGATA